MNTAQLSVIKVNKYITENKYPVIYNHSWD